MKQVIIERRNGRRDFALALEHVVDDAGDDFDAINEALGMDDYEQVDMLADAYEHTVLDGAEVLAAVTQADGVAAGTDYIFLCRDGRLAWPNTMAGMIDLTTRTNWTAAEAAIAIGTVFQNLAR